MLVYYVLACSGLVYYVLVYKVLYQFWSQDTLYHGIE